MKTKMNALDVKASVAEMQSLIGLRLINIYDINAKLFLLKFGHGEHKKMMLIESGVRMHLTSLVREKPKMPSQFTFKLRKHVKSWRLETIEQWANDRTIVLRFGSEQTCFYIIVELYARGNVILTDHEFLILMLLRTHKDGDVKYGVREKYLLPTVVVDPAVLSSDVAVVQQQQLELQQLMYRQAAKLLTEAEDDATLRGTLSAVDSFGPQLAVHAILLAGLTPELKKRKWPPIDALLRQLEQGLLASYRLLRQPLPDGGFLIRPSTASSSSSPGDNHSKKSAGNDDSATVTSTISPTTVADAASGLTSSSGSEVPQQQPPQSAVGQTLTAVKYEDFSPILLQQFIAQPGQFQITGKAKFSDVADEFFYYFEMEKIDTHNEKKQNVAVSPVERLQRQHLQRIKALESESEKNAHKGYLLQMNEQPVQEAIDLINGLLGRGMTWEQLKTLLRERRSEGHPIAQMIHTVHLDRNVITVLLEEELDDDTEDNDVEPVSVEVDLSLSAQRNAGQYYTQKKSVAQKLEKTIAATDKALAGAARKGAKQAAKAGPQKREVFTKRKEFWFEKFYWFISSGGNICLSGRDKQQTDLLIQRYMRDGDIFVSSDATNAFPYLVKGKAKASIPRISVMEAGAMVVNRSACWTSKSSASAWWVYASQVTKGSAGSGCYLNPGMFLVKGERTYMKPLPLALGVTLMFRVSGPRSESDPSFEVAESFRLDCIPPEEIPMRHSSDSSCGETAPPSPPCAKASRSGSAAAAVQSEAQEDEQVHVASPTTTEAVAGCSSLSLEDAASQQQQQDDVVSTHSSQQRKQGKGVSLKALSGRVGARSNATTTTGSSSAQQSSSLPDSSDDGVRSSQRSTSSAQAAQAVLARRNKAKLKKINKKYADQDDEDVARAMTLNGNPVSKVQQDLLMRRAAKSAAASESSTSSSKSKQQQQQQQQQQAASSLSQSAVQDLAASNSDTDQTTSRQQTEEPLMMGDEEGEEEEEPSSSSAAAAAAHLRIVRFASEDITVTTYEPVDKAHDALAKKQQAMQEEYDRATIVMEEELPLGLLTSDPTVTDVIEFCVPMVSTWARVRGRRYAVEVTTGHEKKGHAAGHILTQFQRVAERLGAAISDAERRSIPLVSVEDLTNQLPANLKVHFPAVQPTRSSAALSGSGLRKDSAAGGSCSPHAGGGEAMFGKTHFVDPVA